MVKTLRSFRGFDEDFTASQKVQELPSPLFHDLSSLVHGVVPFLVLDVFPESSIPTSTVLTSGAREKRRVCDQKVIGSVPVLLQAA